MNPFCSQDLGFNSYPKAWVLSVDSNGSGLFFFFFFFLFGCAPQHIGTLFPNQGLNLCLLQWECRVLTTGPLGNSPSDLSEVGLRNEESVNKSVSQQICFGAPTVCQACFTVWILSVNKSELLPSMVLHSNGGKHIINPQ